MISRHFIHDLLACLVCVCCSIPGCLQAQGAEEYDVVVVGGTPGGIAAAVTAAREGLRVVLLERTRHVGGLPANGLGATDISTRGATLGLFGEFVRRNLEHYRRVYGRNSEQVRLCREGYHFEPAIAEQTFLSMLAEQPGITVKLGRQFDALPENVFVTNGRLREIQLYHRLSGERAWYRAGVFIDATYEGDLAAAAGVPYRLGREGESEFNEPMAGRVYKQWGGPVGKGSTGLPDNAVQAYNYRLALTRNPKQRLQIQKPDGYRREEYVSLIADLEQNRTTDRPSRRRAELEWDGIGRVVNLVPLPNDKMDANNQHASFLSTDLPEENWPWPTSSWAWRDEYAVRLRNYTLGLLWFAQHDSALPKSFRRRCREWGLARDEYTDNEGFPRQVYVREGRRIAGEYLFTAHDALPLVPGGRPPLHADSITASHYELDSHAVRKREPGRVNLDGFFSWSTRPYTVPYGVMVPVKVDGLLAPVPVSATHVGYSTLRMEPCWMALGQAAGIAASLSLRRDVPVRSVEVRSLQIALLRQRAVLVYYRDAAPGDAHYEALQMMALAGLVPGWEARLEEAVTESEARGWLDKVRLAEPVEYVAGRTLRGEMLEALYRNGVTE